MARSAPRVAASGTILPMSDPSPPASSSLLKPVYPGYLADPFAWKHEGTWYMIGTAEPGGQIKDGRYFPSLVSRDFKTWEYAGHVLNRPDPSLGSDYWAPEVAYSDGIFYMYYSIGSGDQAHTLRVATSDKPLGPYEDTGVALTDLAQCRFAIDPDPFRDVDGNWYLFYARDFLDTDGGIRAGTDRHAASRRRGACRPAGALRLAEVDG
jgi:arabinan endo-1,5-alpha-L-arabinosidase